MKRRLYAAKGVGEYWLIDPHKRVAEFLRLLDGQYQPCEVDAEGKYRPAAFPGLVFQRHLLWEGDSWDRGPKPFSIEAQMSSVSGKFPKCELGWGYLPFAPQPELESRPLSFEEFISWRLGRSSRLSMANRGSAGFAVLAMPSE